MLVPQQDVGGIGLTIPLLLTGLVLIAALDATSPLAAFGSASAPAATLRLSGFYLALAPYCALFDTLSLMTVRQHLAFIATVFVLYAAWRIWRERDASPARLHPVAIEATAAVVLLLSIATLYASGALGPRPMAALALADSNSIAVDFHSHTSASWDGRQSFTPESNRAWHSAAGFGAAYISDHGSLAGVVAGEAANPARVGEGTVVLPAVEMRCDGQHIVVLGATAADATADCPPAFISFASYQSVDSRPRDDRITVLTIPGNLTDARGLPPVQAIEIADGAPRALDQMTDDRQLLNQIADSAGLARLAGSNTHGWGSTAAAWSVMTIPGWRALTPRALDVTIREQLRRDPLHAVHVIERARVEPPASTLMLAATVPAVAWRMFTSLSTAERVAWLLWIWGAWAVVRLTARRAATRRASRAGTIADTRPYPLSRLA